MIFLVAGSIVGLIVGSAIINRLLHDDVFSRAEAVVSSAFVLVITIGVGALLGLLPASVFDSNVGATCVSPQSTRLYDLFDSTGPTGHLYLGTGAIDGEVTYFYYTKPGDSYQLQQAEGSLSSIYEDNTNTPTVTTYSYQGPTWNVAGQKLPIGVVDGYRGADFHVPPGTVMNNYKVGQ